MCYMYRSRQDLRGVRLELQVLLNPALFRIMYEGDALLTVLPFATDVVMYVRGVRLGSQVLLCSNKEMRLYLPPARTFGVLLYLSCLPVSHRSHRHTDTHTHTRTHKNIHTACSHVVKERVCVCESERSSGRHTNTHAHTHTHTHTHNVFKNRRRGRRGRTACPPCATSV